MPGYQFAVTAKSDGFIAFLDHNLTVEQVLRLSCSDQVTLTDAETDEDGNVYLYGTFKGEVSLGDKSGVSLGGSDLCLIKINPTGLVEDLRVRWSDSCR